MSLPSLQSCFAPLRAITTDFDSDIAQRGESVTTRYPTKPTAVDLSSGYTEQDTTTTAVTVTLDTFYGFTWGFNDLERSKSSINLNDLFIAPSAQALGDKVFGDVWNLVTAANFATNSVITAANFDRDDLADISATLTDTKKAYKDGRSCVVDCQHYASLVKSMNAAEIPGFTAEKAEGRVPRVAGFDIHETDLADDNGESLAGFCFHKSSLLIASRSVDATGAAEAGVEVVDIEVPGIGIPVQFRRWYDPTSGSLRMSVGLLYGVSKGIDTGVRITIV